MNVVLWLLGLTGLPVGPIELTPLIAPAVFGLMVFALGEAIQAPRYYEYVADLAPKEQVGTYMGFAFLPIAIGTFIAGGLSGWLVSHYIGTTVERRHDAGPRLGQPGGHVARRGRHRCRLHDPHAPLRPLRRPARWRALVMMDHRDLAADVLTQARAAGADAADVLVAWGDEFSVTVRNGEVETLEEAGQQGSRPPRLHRSAHGHRTHVGLLDRYARRPGRGDRGNGPGHGRGLRQPAFPTSAPLPTTLDLDLFDPSPMELPTAERIERRVAAEAAALAVPGITNSPGGRLLLRRGQRRPRQHPRLPGHLPHVERGPLGGSPGRARRPDGAGLLVHPRTGPRRSALPRRARAASPRERTLRRLGARQVKTAEVPVVFDPETAAELLGTLYGAISGGAVFRNATFLKDRLGEQVASPLLTVVDDGRVRRGLGSRPFDGEGLPTRRNVPRRERRLALLPLRCLRCAQARHSAHGLGPSRRLGRAVRWDPETSASPRARPHPRRSSRSVRRASSSPT